jgi:CRP-like cAMP-binding protein
MKVGEVERERGARGVLSVGVREFFNEENILFDAPMQFEVRATEESSACLIDAGIVAGIPVVRRKLFETFLLRMQAS